MKKLETQNNNAVYFDEESKLYACVKKYREKTRISYHATFKLALAALYRHQFNRWLKIGVRPSIMQFLQ